MLVLSRKTHQQLRIGDHVTITILGVKGSAVRIGIEAPRNVRVIRAELKPFGEEPSSGEPQGFAIAPHEPTSDAGDSGVKPDTGTTEWDAARRRAVVTAVRQRLAR